MASSIEPLSYRKLALVICNGDYKRSGNRLEDAAGTGRALQNKLQQIGFQVTLSCNVEKHEMTTTIMTFAKTVRSGDLVVFYYFGQGCQLKDRNYLIPVGDDQIERASDIEQFAIDFERLFQRFVEKNCLANVWVLDCCGTYSFSGSKASSEGQGLAAMKPKEGVLLQFACGANQGVSDNSFTRCFLQNVTQENISLTDLFRHIATRVAEKSGRKQQPLTTDGLKRSKEVYLNEVVHRQVWVHLEPNEIPTLQKKQQELRACYDNYPNIDEVMNRDTPDMRKAETLTNLILSKSPSGNVNDTNTVLHAMKNLVATDDRECLFFDSREGVRLHDASTNLTDLNTEEKPFVLKLRSSAEFVDHKDPNDRTFDLRVIKTLDDAIQNNSSHPVLDDIKEKLAKAHRISKNDVMIKTVYEGSFNVVYTLKHLGKKVFDKMVDLSHKLKEQFKEFAAALLHPLLFRPSFDIAQFDSKGNKTFSSAETHQVGPRGREKTYKAPVGYTRYGLKVLDRYGSNEWLEPFGDPRNWYRAYHGTGRATAADFGKEGDSLDKQYACVDAAANIHQTGFRKARVHVHGEGVYCSPAPSFVEGGYSGKVSLDTTEGLKRFEMMLQVAVNPDDVEIANNDIWVVKHPESIRAYGILIKEI